MMNHNREEMTHKNKLKRRVKAHQLALEDSEMSSFGSPLTAMNNLPKFGGSQHLLSQMEKRTSKRERKEDRDKFGEAFKIYDYIAAKIQNDHRHDESIEYTTIDLDETVSSLHKKILRKYGQKYVSLLDDVDTKQADILFEQSFMTDGHTIPDDTGILESIPLQSQEMNQELYNVSKIVNHIGPLEPGQENYKGCSYNVMVEWLHGDNKKIEVQTLSHMVHQVPEMMAEYAITNKLTKEKGWKSPRLQSYVRKFLKEKKKRRTRQRKTRSDLSY